MNIPLLRFLAVLVLIPGVTTTVRANDPTAQATSLFEPPIRLEANDKIIDTGAAWGHSSPCVEDLDGDGLTELIVGDFGGKFRYYRNVGTAKNPAYEAGGRIQADGAVAEVRIYCCIGSQARFCDLDGDGIRDMLANSYDPGHCYHFKQDLSNEQKQEVKEFVAESRSLGKEFAEKMGSLRKEFLERYPGDEAFSEEANTEWSKAYQALRESPELIETSLVGLMRCLLVAGLFAAVGCGETHEVGDQPLDPVVRPPASADRPSAEMTGNGTTGDQQVTAFPGVKLRSAGDPVAASFKVPESGSRADGSFLVSVVLDIAPFYEIHDQHAPPPAVATRLELKLPEGMRAVDQWTLPDAVRSAMPDGHGVYVGEATFTRKVRIGSEVDPGQHQLNCAIRYQACDARQCLRPVDCILGAVVSIEP